MVGMGGGRLGRRRAAAGFAGLAVRRSTSRRFRPRIIVAACGLLYLIASGFYLGSFRLERAPDTVLIAAPASLRGEVERLGKAFAAETGRRYELVVPAEAIAPAGILSSGLADCVLAGAGSPGLDPAKVVAARGAPALYLPALLAVPFPSPHVAVNLEEAKTIMGDLASGRPGPWPGVTVEVIGLGDRTPARQLLAVDGVYPTLETVTSGAYPLAREVRLYTRRGPSGLFGLLGRLGPLARWVQPNRDAVSEFAAWLGSPGARTVLYGTGKELTLTAVGDVWFARHVGEVIDKNGLDYPFALVADRLAAADITWCSLESPLGVTGTPLPGKLIWFRAKPETVECLKPPGIDILALANNHIVDYDSPSLIETLDILDANGIAYCGAGRNEAEARQPAVLEAGGLKVAFLAYTEYADPSLHWSYGYPRTLLALPDRPGCNPLYLGIVAEDIARAKETADLVVVGYHWGVENVEQPKPYHPWNDIPDIARQTIDLGACLVLGTHPHAVQGFEPRGQGLIAYSLGNFVTDQLLDTQREGTILEVELGESGVLSARIVPVWSEGFRPRLMEPGEAAKLLEKIERISRMVRQKG